MCAHVLIKARGVEPMALFDRLRADELIETWGSHTGDGRSW
jgi:hypothetical protein